MVLAWLKGGHPERLGAVALLAAFGFSAILPEPVRIGDLIVNDAVNDLALAIFFSWLALRRERWWPLFVASVMILTVLVHVVTFLVPTLGEYENVSARIGLGIALGLGLIAGVGERWLAGERPVSDLGTRSAPRTARISETPQS